MAQTLSPALTAKTNRSKVRIPARVYHDAEDVARSLNPEQPLFLFSEQNLEERLGRFEAGFPGRVSYAVKANSRPEVIRAASKAGLRLYDVASTVEMAGVRREAPFARFNYHNPVKSRDEIITALDTFGVKRFAVDDRNEIEKVFSCALGRIAAEDLEIAVRFRLPKHGVSAHDFSSKFGVTPEAAVLLLKDVVARGAKPVLTFHPGSQCADPSAFVRYIEAAAAISRVAGIPLHVLNVGGGFPSRYPRADAPELEDFFAAIAAARTACFPANDQPELECEPGRGLVATSASLLTKVKLRRADVDEIFLNDGIYGGLMEGYQVPSLSPAFRAFRADGTPMTGEMKPFTVFGPT